MKHILVAEDDAFLRELLESQLVDDSYQVSSVADGEAVLAFLDQHAVDLLILDISMPKIGGLAVLETIRANAALEKLPVIAFTNDDSPEIREKIASLGAHYHFKAITDTTLLFADIAVLLGTEAA
jgi:CheY-like chemotaxis protein